MDACRAGHLSCAISELVLAEARKALWLKSDIWARERLLKSAGSPSVQIFGIPVEDQLQEMSGQVVTKDRHVVVSAIESGCDFLVTLDRKHLLIPSILALPLPFVIQTPGDYFQNITYGFN